MNHLPTYWGRASFSVAEVAELIGVTEDALRGWLARNPTNEFLGTRIAKRVSLSCQDAYFYFLVGELTAYGVPVRSAMHAAAGVALGASDNLPADDYLVVRTNGGVSEFSLTDELPKDERSALVLPIRALAEVLIADAGEVYATEAT